MPSNTEWRDMEQGLGRDAHRFEGHWRGGSFGVILGVWLAFYLLAVTHALLGNGAAPVVTAEAEAPVHGHTDR
mgnify:CR=1 FL=1|jgi:hypothetical protein